MNQEMVYNTENLATYSATSEIKKYTPYELTKETSSILRENIKDFDFSDPELDPIEISSRLIETIKLYKGAYSLAANQCGLPYNVFVAGSGEEFVAFFNPEIIVESPATSIMAESDLSNMGLSLHIKRPSSVTIGYQDYTGEQKIIQFDGLTSRIVQQNIDRLNGIDFKDKVSKFVLDRSKKALNKKIKRFFKGGIN